MIQEQLTIAPFLYKYDLHLSAYAISSKTIELLESHGFQRDMFANNRYCDTTAYHGTYRGKNQLPDNILWENLQKILSQDTDFIGCLEEERFDTEKVVIFTNPNISDDRKIPLIRLPFRSLLEDEKKACDIHLNISLDDTSFNTIEYISDMEMASFDKPSGGKVSRVFSATCESLEMGRELFNFLNSLLKKTPNLYGKMKFEETTRVVRIPTNSPALPFIPDHELRKWLNEVLT